MKVGGTAIGLAILLFAKSAGAQTTTTTFRLFPNPAFVNCLRKSPLKIPKAIVTVTKGNLRDTLTLTLKNVKPGLAFDLFTVEHSNQLFNGDPDPGFTNFGLAWYQSDVEADDLGTATVTIKTILLNQIFGFDPGVALPPTNTFHVGFWFNDPNDAATCGFNVNNPTPFNGEHEAGPLAMISRPDETTGLGPLCINPNTSTDPATCNP
jgi:hypothetical protein